MIVSFIIIGRGHKIVEGSQGECEHIFNYYTSNMHVIFTHSMVGCENHGTLLSKTYQGVIMCLSMHRS